VTLAVDMTKACLFDPETEMLIQPTSHTSP
jgi:hypothetical protein